MRTRVAAALVALSALAWPAAAEERQPIPLVPEVPVESLTPAPPTPIDDESVTFDTMESIPFENAVEPAEEPPPIPSFDNSGLVPAADNAAPAAGTPPPPAPSGLQVTAP